MIGAVFRKRRMEINIKQRGKQIANSNLPKPNSLQMCDVSSAVHIYVIRIALEATQAIALHVETAIIYFGVCCFGGYATTARKKQG